MKGPPVRTGGDQYTFIDLFAGIGGFRLGFEAAGCKCVYSNEYDRYAQQTYEANFGERPEGDIRCVQARDIPEHDILVGGFPCQPFSIAGVSKHTSLGVEHGFGHPTQGTLFFDIVRVLEHHRPRAFVLENVKNLRSHDHGRTFRIIMTTLQDDLGYTVYQGIRDAQALVPQHRERVFIVGFREPTHFALPTLLDTGRRLADILETDVDQKYTLSDHLWKYLQDYAAKHRAKGNGFGYGLSDLNGITRTLSARYYKDGSEILVPQEGRNPRRLTPRECARLMGFPDWFRIVVSDTRAYKQFGNAVVVPVAEAVAKEVVHTLSMPSPQPVAPTTLPSTHLPSGRFVAACASGGDSIT